MCISLCCHPQNKPRQFLIAARADWIDLSEIQVPHIVELEKKAIGLMAKHANHLIERRRQDIRDQAKEISDSSSKFNFFTFII